MRLSGGIVKRNESKMKRALIFHQPGPGDEVLRTPEIRVRSQGCATLTRWACYQFHKFGGEPKLLVSSVFFVLFVLHSTQVFASGEGF